MRKLTGEMIWGLALSLFLMGVIYTAGRGIKSRMPASAPQCKVCHCHKTKCSKQCSEDSMCEMRCERQCAEVGEEGGTE